MTKTRRDSRRCRSGTALCSFLLAASLVLVGCSEKIAPGTASVKRPAVTGVSVATIVPVQVDEFTEASGTVKAATTTSVASRIMGTVTSLSVKEGDRVQAGQVLLTIDDRDMIEKVRGAEAGHEEAAKALATAGQNREMATLTYERYRKLFDEKAVSRQEMDQVATQRKVAELEYERLQEMVKRAAAGVAEARVYLGFTRVVSPTAGIVTEKRVDPGSMAVPGVPLLTLDDAVGFRAEIGVDESLAGRLKAGASVDVAIASLNRQIRGNIMQILPAVDPQSRTFLVKVSLSGEGLRSGLYAKARIPLGKKEAILIPEAAVVEKGQLTGVYAVDQQGLITYRPVKVGHRYDGGREVLTGLAVNDRIIVQGVEKAVDGGMLEGGK